MSKASNFFIIFVKGIFFFSWFFSCGEFDPKIGVESEIPSKEGFPYVVTSTFQTISFEEEKKNWLIKSKTALIFNQKNETLMDEVIFITYDSKEKEATSITADHATLNNNTRNVTLRSNVVIVNAQGTETTGDLFYWNNKDRTFTSPLDVKVVKSNGSVIKGQGFKSDQQLGGIEFESNVTGELTSDEEEDFFDGF